MRRWIFVFLTLFYSVALFAATDHVVNLFIWADYIPQNVIHSFEKKTGIHVNLSEYDSNEDLYAKLKADPNSGYDVVVPSTYYVGRMRREGMLQPLNTSALPNSRFLNPLLLHKPFDPENRYTVPYLWGTTGIVLDKRYWNPASIHTWRDLWQSRFKNQLLLYDDARTVFAMGLLSLGDRINTQSAQKIKQAYRHLQNLMPNVRLFSSDAAISAFADDDVTIGMAESGDVILARAANPNLVYIYPKDGFIIWEDCFAVPKNAPHYKNAMRFINFMMRPKMALLIALSQGYSTPNLKAKAMLPKRLREDPVMYPSNQTLKRGQMLGDVKSARKLYLHYWQYLKIS